MRSRQRALASLTRLQQARRKAEVSDQSRRGSALQSWAFSFSRNRRAALIKALVDQVGFMEASVAANWYRSGQRSSALQPNSKAICDSILRDLRKPRLTVETVVGATLR